MNHTWQQKARGELTRAVTYCTRTFGKRVAEKFVDLIDHQVSLILLNPYIGQRIPGLDTPRRQLRSLVVHEHYQLIYYVDEKKQQLYIVSLWDTRRDPLTLTHRIQRKKK